jgi:hypothetical protein
MKKKSHLTFSPKEGAAVDMSGAATIGAEKKI